MNATRMNVRGWCCIGFDPQYPAGRLNIIAERADLGPFKIATLNTRDPVLAGVESFRAINLSGRAGLAEFQVLVKSIIGN
jgi:hypothetical protein